VNAVVPAQLGGKRLVTHCNDRGAVTMNPELPETPHHQTVARASSWDVALAQLPGCPGEVRYQAFHAVSAAIDRMPVSARRDHFWAGGAASKLVEVADDDVFDEEIEMS
jgi:hypothetical protein